MLGFQDEVEELSSLKVFGHQVDVPGVLVYLIELHYVRVVELLHDSYLIGECG